MKKIKLTKIFAGAICAAIVICGAVFMPARPNTQKAAADTDTDTDFCIDDISLFFSSDDELKCRLKLYIPAPLFYPVDTSTYVSALGEQVYTESLDVVISTIDSKCHGDRLKKMVEPTPTVTDGVKSYIFSGIDSSAYYESEVQQFCNFNNLILKRFNKGDGSTVFDYTDTDSVCLLNLDFSLPKVQDVMKNPDTRTLYDFDFSFYCVRSTLHTYSFENDPSGGTDSSSYFGMFYLIGTDNVFSYNIADKAKKMLKDNSATYTTEQLSVLKTVAGPISDESDSANKSNGDSFKSLKKAIMAVCGIAIVAGVCVCVYSIVKRKKLSFIPARRKTSGDKVRKRKK